MSNPLLIAVGTTDTTITVTGPILNAPNGGVIQIGTEDIFFTHATDTQYLGCTRAFNSTSAAAHAIGAAVTNITDRTTLTVVELSGAGAPTDGITGVNLAPVGSRYTNTSSGGIYVNTGTATAPTWVLLVAGNAITQLTGDVTAGPASGSTAATIATGKVTPSKISAVATDDYTFPRDTITTRAMFAGTSTQPTTTARSVLAAAASKLASVIVGLAIDSSTDTDGLGFYLLHNANNNRQLGLCDSKLGPVASTAVLRIAFTPGVSIDAFNGDLSGAQPLTLGNASASTVMPGVVSFSKAPAYAVGTILGTGTVTPVATAGPTFTATVSGALTINGPTAGVDGQKVTFRIINDASHSVTLATGSGNFRFGADITSYTNSVSLTDYVGAIWNSTDSRWDVVSIVKGY